MAHSTSVPRIDFQPTLPAIPALASTHPENIGVEPFLAAGVTLDALIVALPSAVDQAMRTTLPSLYSAELAERIAAHMISRLRQEHGEPSRCPLYRDCEDTTPGHTDHYFHRLRVTGEDGGTVLDAGMVALSGSETGAVVYIRNEEFADAASVHAKTAELRGFLDQVDALADRLFEDHQARS
ncbi:hypothetical protein ACH4OT_04415 [Streptomyces murinus]|uniref:hypothetical protein n=1 Tax=Streptomyces murinus TaxID=33900 RepID=UPI0037988FF3